MSISHSLLYSPSRALSVTRFCLQFLCFFMASHCAGAYKARNSSKCFFFKFQMNRHQITMIEPILFVQLNVYMPAYFMHDVQKKIHFFPHWCILISQKCRKSKQNAHSKFYSCVQNVQRFNWANFMPNIHIHK